MVANPRRKIDASSVHLIRITDASVISSGAATRGGDRISITTKKNQTRVIPMSGLRKSERFRLSGDGERLLNREG